MLTVQPLAHDRIPLVVAQLCAADRAELDAAGIADADAMLREAVPMCAWADLVLWDGKPIAVFGVRPLPGGVGVPWMLSTVHLDGAGRRAVALQARREVARMREQFGALVNLVHCQNRRALAFVKWLGFDVDEEQPRGPQGQFYVFRWQRV